MVRPALPELSPGAGPAAGCRVRSCSARRANRPETGNYHRDPDALAGFPDRRTRHFSPRGCWAGTRRAGLQKSGRRRWRCCLFIFAQPSRPGAVRVLDFDRASPNSEIAALLRETRDRLHPRWPRESIRPQSRPRAQIRRGRQRSRSPCARNAAATGRCTGQVGDCGRASASWGNVRDPDRRDALPGIVQHGCLWCCGLGVAGPASRSWQHDGEWSGRATDQGFLRRQVLVGGTGQVGHRVLRRSTSPLSVVRCRLAPRCYVSTLAICGCQRNPRRTAALAPGPPGPFTALRFAGTAALPTWGSMPPPTESA